MEELNFYDLKTKKKFKSNNYEYKKRESRGKTVTFAVSQSPYSDIQCWRIVKVNP